MGEILLGYEREIYTLIFFAAVTGVAVWEGIAPRRETGTLLRRRWRGNIALAIINVAVVNSLLPVLTVGFAMAVEARGYGVLRLVEAPLWMAAIFAIIGIELGRYTHHYLLHRVSFLWRFHRIHHADLDYDFTVGFRFHPIEALFTILFTFAVIALIGPPSIVVLGMEAVVAVSGAVVHANGRTPRWVEHFVRWIFVTPDMHRIHHSFLPAEHNSNYAAVFSIWDRLFGTYVAEPAQSHETMQIGLPDLRDQECLDLSWMLISPLRKDDVLPFQTASQNSTETPS